MRTRSSSGTRRRRPRTMSPSKFSSLASLITEQPLRLGSSKQDFAEVALRSLECLDSSPCFLGLLVTFPQVVLERGWGRKVVTDYCVDVGQFERVIGLHDGLGRGTSLEGMNHQFQEHATVADAKDPRWLLTERDRDRERFKIHGCHGISSSVYRIFIHHYSRFLRPVIAQGKQATHQTWEG